MKRITLICVLLAVFSLVLYSCEETTGKGNLKVILDTSAGNNTKTIKPDDKTSTVVKYNIRGTGPGGKTFSKDSASKSVTIEGLSMGNWTIAATGYNSSSSPIITGSKTFTFSNTSKTVTVNMSSYSGSGSLHIDFKWDSEITDPVLEVVLEGNGTPITGKYKPTDKSNTYSYSKNNLPAGSYTLRAYLYNTEIPITGCVEAVQIVNDQETDGSISLSSASSSQEERESLYIINKNGNLITGHFSLSGSSSLSKILEARKEQTVNLVLDSTIPDSEQLSVSWYLDGVSVKEPEKLLQEGSSLTVTPDVGTHVLNAIVFNSSSGSTGSLSWKFTAKTMAQKGQAVLLDSIGLDNTEKLVLAADSIISVLPDGFFLLVTPSRSTMQVFSIFNNKVLLAPNQTYNATDPNLTWLGNVTGVYSDSKMNYFVLQDGINSVHIMYFNPTSCSVSLAYYKNSPLAYVNVCSDPPAFMNNITSVGMIPTTGNGGKIFFGVSGDMPKEMLGLVTSASEVTAFGTSTKDTGMNNIISIDGTSALIGVIVENNILKYAKLGNATVSSSWSTLEITNLTNVNEVTFLNSNFVLFSSPNALRIYEYYPSASQWVNKSLIDTQSTDTAISPDGAYIYVADNGGNLASYRSGLSDNFAQLGIEQLETALTQLVYGADHLVGLDATGNLYTFEIAQEDN